MGSWFESRSARNKARVNTSRLVCAAGRCSSTVTLEKGTALESTVGGSRVNWLVGNEFCFFGEQFGVRHIKYHL